MKKTLSTIIIVTVLLSVLQSCISPYPPTTGIQADGERSNPARAIKQNHSRMTVERCEFDGHCYLIFREKPRYRKEACQVIHDPDCPCHKTEAAVDATPAVNNSDDIEWRNLLMAIVMTESRFNPSTEGKHGDKGIFQQTPIYVKEVNRILGEDRYTAEDAFDIEKSVSMFNIVQGYHNKEKDPDRAIYLQNKKAKTYGAAVRKNLRFIERMETVRDALNKQISYNNK